MKLTFQFVLGLLIASNIAYASRLVHSVRSTPIPLERRNMLILDNNVLNFAAMNRHFKALDRKFSSAMDNYERNTGHIHPFKVAVHPKKRGKWDGGDDGDDESPFDPFPRGVQVLGAGWVLR